MERAIPLLLLAGGFECFVEAAAGAALKASLYRGVALDAKIGKTKKPTASRRRSFPCLEAVGFFRRRRVRLACASGRADDQAAEETFTIGEGLHFGRAVFGKGGVDRSAFLGGQAVDGDGFAASEDAIRKSQGEAVKGSVTLAGLLPFVGPRRSGRIGGRSCRAERGTHLVLA